ncbi:MAG: putative bicarbonate transporter, IctB family [Parcubacteria group bacterium GW2011_GWE2_39_37]|uniref:Putative bicarbonate transporter, IctB family n=1 Tax=Candidatus Falkowbacteria bacterium GW2011_GWF2_39_8 TaxID=1618642 RepID=A0A0G0Q547_9BACT|nr:MAG: putative bicarbonate transporter, IctB family [Parcubacteria group bacterium GW2011_GWE2_39_37]KKR32496.1 MAG: putative bicarbonate transporter, IctB family [Candidatus Falkowbacteria bacterium GW2011_GWF2_39_8]
MKNCFKIENYKLKIGMSFYFIVFIAFFIFLSIKRLDWSLMLLFFLLPSYLIRFNFVVPFTLLEVMILIVFLTWFFKNGRQVLKNLKNKFSGRKIVSDYPFKWEMIFLLVISFAAVGVAGITNEALGIWKAYFFEPLLLYIVVVNVFGRPTLQTLHTQGEDYSPPLQGGVADLSAEALAKEEGRGGVSRIIWPLALSALAVSLFAIYQKFTGQFISNPLWAAEATRRVTSIFGYPNAVGLYVESIIFLILGLLLSIIEKRIFNFQFSISKQFSILKLFILLLSIIFSVLAIIFAKSVGAVLGVAAGSIVFLLLYGKKIRLITLAIIIFTSIGIVSYQPLRHQALKHITLNDFSGQVRKSQWKETWQMLNDGKIITGAGLSGYQKAVAPFHVPGIFVKDFDDPDAQRKLVFNEAYRNTHWQPLEIYLYPHNIFLNFWTEVGLLGMALFIWIIVKFFYLGFKLLLTVIPEKSGIQFQVSALISAMTAIVVHGLVDVPYFKNDLAALFWLLMAMMSILYLENKKEV